MCPAPFKWVEWAITLRGIPANRLPCFEEVVAAVIANLVEKGAVCVAYLGDVRSIQNPSPPSRMAGSTLYIPLEPVQMSAYICGNTEKTRWNGRSTIECVFDESSTAALKPRARTEMQTGNALSVENQCKTRNRQL
jgi:hypothetical protein